jgi:shikimate kinase
VLSAENRTALKQAGLLVYLRATPETLAGRLTGVTDRPLLGDTADRAGRIRDLLVARGPIYETAGGRGHRHRPAQRGAGGRRGHGVVPAPGRRLAGR